MNKNLLISYLLLIIGMSPLNKLNAEELKVNSKWYLQLGVGNRNGKKVGYKPASSSVFGSRWISTSSDTVQDYGIGYILNKNFRASLNYKSYTHNFSDYYNGNTFYGEYLEKPEYRIDAYTLNFYIDLPKKEGFKFTPYFGAGFGIGKVSKENFGTYLRSDGALRSSNSGPKNHDEKYYQFIAGVSTPISKRGDLYIESTYGGVGTVKGDDLRGRGDWEYKPMKNFSYSAGFRIKL